MQYLDGQLQQWSTRLRDDLRIGPPESNQLATAIAREVSALPDDAKQRVKDVSKIPLRARIDELVAFQGWMDYVRAAAEPQPVVVRAQVIYQDYVCFVYLGDSCFNILAILSYQVTLPEPQFLDFKRQLDLERSKSDYSYGFPNGDGDCNCVTWIERLGLPLLTGRMDEFAARPGIRSSSQRRFGLCI